MSYSTNVNNQSHSIDLTEQTITLDGSQYTLDWHKIAPLATTTTTGGYYSLIIAGQSYEIFARLLNTPDEKNSSTYEIILAGKRFEATVEDERIRKLSGQTRSTSTSSTARLYAPMPGLVVQVLPQLSETVQEGQTVVVLEAMKMENDLSAPITGTIKELCVNQGQTVEQGQLLLIIEKPSI